MTNSITVETDFRGQQYVCETMRKSNVTTKRNFPVYRGQYEESISVYIRSMYQLGELCKFTTY